MWLMTPCVALKVKSLRKAVVEAKSHPLDRDTPAPVT
jgi:hypothetical protein